MVSNEVVELRSLGCRERAKGEVEVALLISLGVKRSSEKMLVAAVSADVPSMSITSPSPIGDVGVERKEFRLPTT